MLIINEGKDELTPEERRRRKLRLTAPDNQIPGSLALDRVIGRTDDLAVILVGGRLFSYGIELRVEVTLRGFDEDEGLSEQAFADPTCAASGTALLLGFGYPDGRRTTNLRFGRHTFAPADDDTLRLQAQGGGGGHHTVTMHFWLSPLPPPGDIDVVCAWPHRGIAETHTAITADEIDRARGHLSELWPWEAEPVRAERPAPAPPVVPDGWFAEALKNEKST